MEQQEFIPIDYPVRLPKVILIPLLLLIVVEAGVAAWFIKGGYWTAAAVMGIVFIPLTAIYWYILYVAPSATRVIVGPEAFVLEVPPYFSEVLVTERVQKAYVTDLKTDEHLQVAGKKSGTSFGPYKCGVFETTKGKELVIVASRSEVVCMVTESRIYALGPDNIDGFVQDLDELTDMKMG